MNRLVRGSIMLAAAVVAWACSSSLGDDPDKIDTLSATPTVLFVANNDSQNVDVEALNQEGQQLAADFTVSNTGAGINVTLDTLFLIFPGQGNSPTRARYSVRAASTTSFVSTSFTVSSGGHDVTIPVSVTPANLDIAVPGNPLPGEVVTLTAPANVRFTPQTTVDAPGGAQVTSLSADSSQITVVFNVGNIGATVTVNNVVVTYLPGQTFNLPLTTPITTDSIASFHLTTNTLAPNTGDQVTITIPAPFKATPASVVTIPGTGTAIFSVSADSSTVIFLVGPNANGPVTINNLRIGTATNLGPFTLSTAGTLTSPALTSFTAGYSTSTPNANQNVTITAAGFKFGPGTKVFIGNDQQTVISVAADSNSAIFRAHAPGASGTLSVADIRLSFLNAVGLTLNATAGVTVGATINTLAGTDQLATAPLVEIPDAGKTGGVFDNSPFATGPAICNTTLGGPCRLYKFVTTVARTFGVAASWDNSSDIGIYFTNSGGTALVGTTACDAHGPAPGNFESCTVTALAAGTYFIVVDDFSPFYGPPDDVPAGSFQVDLTGQ